MPSVNVHLNNIAGTEAAIGWAGSHTIVADRPAGKAGGLGLGFNGAEMLALAIGGCFCNDLRYVAHSHAVEIAEIDVQVTLFLEGDPIIATSAEMVVTCFTKDGIDAVNIIEEAKLSCMVSNSIAKGVPVSILLSDLRPRDKPLPR
ncbi:OsmC family peroxiredoxin [Ruegeria sediminis]|uniref:OsmC family peroxiredoxin n=1 Tax=Ruegeria sediminis TaxID=2583820 RepID=A0ABY2X5E4_9RHOB|nr:OsmC family protein [Ruegeria sediminis]TMV10318.1 OsmC family peroxiredoxin [Ruegeria sediminis]